jgi:hypothetical protein
MYPVATFIPLPHEVGMQPRTFKPFLIGWRCVEVNNGCKAEREIGAWNLRAIGSPKVRVGSDCVVIQGRGVAHVYVRINQSRYEKLPAPVYPPGERTGNKIRADLNDFAVANHDICTRQGGGAFRRDQSDIFDHYALTNGPLRVSGGPNIENDQRSQYSDKQSIAQEHPRPIQISVAT